MSPVDLDMSEVAQLADDFDKAAEKVFTAVKATTVKAGISIRDNARAIAPRHYTPAYPASIFSRTTYGAASVTSTVQTRNPLGAILEFGSPTSAAYAHFGPSFDREVPTWLGFIDQAIDAGFEE